MAPARGRVRATGPQTPTASGLSGTPAWGRETQRQDLACGAGTGVQHGVTVLPALEVHAPLYRAFGLRGAAGRGPGTLRVC